MVNSMTLLLKYRTYYKQDQYKKYGLSKHEDDVVVVNTNDPAYPFSKKLNRFWSEYALIREIWQAGKKSEYIGIEQYAEKLPKIKLDNVAVYYRRVLPKMSRTVYEQYKKFHISSDMDLLIKVLNRKYGNTNKYSDYLLNGRKLYYGSIFIMKWEVFDEMCKFLFGTLDDLDKELGLNFDVKKYEEYFVNNPKREKVKIGDKDNYQMRAFGFLAERLVSTFIVTTYNSSKSLVQVKRDSNNNPIVINEENPIIDSDNQVVVPKVKLRPAITVVKKTNPTTAKRMALNKTKVYLGSGLNW